MLHAAKQTDSFRCLIWKYYAGTSSAKSGNGTLQTRNHGNVRSASFENFEYELRNFGESDWNTYSKSVANTKYSKSPSEINERFTPKRPSALLENEEPDKD